MFAKRLTQLMCDSGITQAELAQKSGLTKASISQYVNGRNKPGGRSLKAIADALGVPEMYLTEEPEKKTPDAEYDSELPMLLSVKQVSRILGVGPQCVRINVQKGIIPGYSLTGKGKRFTYRIFTRRFMEDNKITKQQILSVL